ncbi:hypothetical protein LOC68_23125 [Blastopirellula sp. JC732]|uniref:Polysaccharide chain length determinant N-terminal domain-containing protein n=1 Tax=Blastopirellula sediminis TaxID=2894196 RepID=A0A9X1MR07_9BACT|nr:hypothetical protein [Blastopirellula sediminis]MCC9605404.1 hypothetical protein [Blastopirellula sediminis]MCC9631296.1 hypothetical protein [Blastopirellula sediminis]
MIDPPKILALLLAHRYRWIVPAAVITIAAVGYALLKPKMWSASQTLVLREISIGGLDRPGAFARPEDMKTAQETIQTIARSREVVTRTLEKIGAPPTGLFGQSPDAWPTADDIATYRNYISVGSPSGTEFGTTEIFLIHVEAETQSRAALFATTLCDELDYQLEQVRDHKAQSVVAELEESERLAAAVLHSSTEKLSKLEGEVGSDLAELRILNESGSGDGNLRQQFVQVEAELRAARDQQQSNDQLLALLEAAAANPQELLATPNSLLDSQPALRRLKDGLVDAQLRTAELQGTRTADHPSVQSALGAESEVRDHLFKEIAVAVRGLKAERSVLKQRIEGYTKQRDQVSDRMVHLAEVRASYGNLESEVRQRSEKLAEVQRNLSDARSSLAAAHATSLLTRVGLPEVSDYPIGPSRKAIVVAGVVGGLVCGFGLLFLTINPAQLVEPVQSAPIHQGAVNGARIETDLQPIRKLSFTDALRHLAKRASQAGSR